MAGIDDGFEELHEKIRELEQKNLVLQQEVERLRNERDEYKERLIRQSVKQ